MEVLIALAGIGGIAALLMSPQVLPSEADFKKAQDKLKVTPDDPDANTISGKYLAFVLGNYDDGMTYFTRSADKTLRTLAEHERAPLYVDTAPKKIGMADEWVVAARDYKPLYRTFYDRASTWYELAWPDVDGIWRDKLRERGRKLLSVPRPGAIKAGAPTGWTTSDQKIFIDSTVAHNGEKSVKIDGGKDKNRWGNQGITTPLLVAPKGKVVFSAWVASDGTNDANDRIVMTFFGQNGNYAGNTGPFLPIDSPFWHRVEVKFDIPKEVARFNVGIGLWSTKGTLWVDDVSVKSEDGKELIDNGSFER